MAADRQRPGRLEKWAWVLSLGLLCCASAQKNLWSLGIPGVSTPFLVTKATPRGGYIDAVLTGKGITLQSYVPLGETCAFVLREEAEVAWINAGPTGGFRREGQECHAAGIGSLHEWRDRGPRPQSLRGSPVPRAQANYRVVYRDDDVAFLRGRFPLSGRIGWTEGGDTLAVVPNDEVCQGPIGRSTSSMQYYPKGRNVLVLVAQNALCPIVGLVRPLPGGAEGSASGAGAAEVD
jgi:hypothetical protein